MKLNVKFKKGQLCLGCRQKHSEEDVYISYKNSCICKKCYSEFEFFDEEFVLKGTKETEFVATPFVYGGLYRDIFLNFKFNGEFAAGHIIGKMLSEYFIGTDLADGFDFIVPVPLSKRRLLKRGYNQTELLAEYAGAALGLEVKNILERTCDTKPQSSLIGYERINNVKNAFRTEADISGKSVFLFDDIITTGSTVNECAKVLKKAGAGRVAVISAAASVQKKVPIY